MSFLSILSSFVLAGVLAAGSVVNAAPLPSDVLAAKGTLTIQFRPLGGSVPEGTVVNDGSEYSPSAGCGWDRDMTPHIRLRASGFHGVVLLDRAVQEASFRVDLPDGDYLFRLESQDDFPGVLAPKIDGGLAGLPVPYTSAAPVAVTIPVTSRNGKAAIALVGGKDGLANSMISTIVITPASDDPSRWQTAKRAVETYQAGVQEQAARREAERARLRRDYRPIALSQTGSGREVIDLDGRWLFMPSEDTDASSATSPSADDDKWHVMDVPQFWKPIQWWLYTPERGASHNFLRVESARCESLTFDYGKTHSGWYRQWIDVPESFRGRRLIVRFGAVASIAQVFWNGKEVGAHAGMFGPFECEVTRHVRFGDRNLLSVFVSATGSRTKADEKVAAVAVTMKITQDMLSGLPHGGFRADLAGIWQPVKLEVTGRNRIADVFFSPRTDGASMETTVDRTTADNLAVSYTIADAATGLVLYRDSRPRHVPLGKGSVVIRSDFGGLHPKLWSPEHPNLYILRTRLISNGSVVDDTRTTVGFRSFEVRGRKLYLNGRPYYLRGADMPPHGLRPNDASLANKFMKLMHDGNTMVTRFHMCLPTEVWLDAADKQGVGVSVEGAWPWMLINQSQIPDKRVLDAWRNEFLELVRAYRNHPSVLLFTVANESYFEGGHDPDIARKTEKYKIFSEMIGRIRAACPGIPVVFHSGYRRPALDEKLIRDNKIDDGDIDDAHFYFGWYRESPYSMKVSDLEKVSEAANRPLISQEASTGYPDNDTGHATEGYIYQFRTPQAWVGRYGEYNHRPEMFLDVQAQITKDYAEKVRRDRKLIAGFLLFANVNWFKDVYDSDRIAPYPVYWAVRKAYQPVLVSLDTANRHLVAGQEFTSEVVVVNDDPDSPRLRDLSLVWRMHDESGDMGTSGVLSVPDCPYDSRSRTSVTFRAPSKLMLERSNVVLELELRQGDEVVSRNDYPLICARPEWCFLGGGPKLVVVSPDGGAASYLREIGCNCETMRAPDWTSLDTSVPVVVTSDASGAQEGAGNFVLRGGRLLILSTGSATPLDLIPDFPAQKVKQIGVEGDYADVLASDLLDGMDPMDTHWWNASLGDFVRVCRTSYQFADIPGVEKLVQHIQPHGYGGAALLERSTSWPVFEVTRGKGRVIVDSLLTADDPVAKRFMRNVIQRLLR